MPKRLRKLLQQRNGTTWAGPDTLATSDRTFEQETVRRFEECLDLESDEEVDGVEEQEKAAPVGRVGQGLYSDEGSGRRSSGGSSSGGDLPTVPAPAQGQGIAYTGVHGTGKTYHVRAEGSIKLAQCLEVAIPGDVIVVYPGIHYVNLTIRKAIVLRAPTDVDYRVKLISNIPGQPVLVLGGDPMIVGVKIKQLYDAPAVVVDDGSPMMDRCVIRSKGRGVNVITPANLGPLVAPTLKGCFIVKCGERGIVFTHAAGWVVDCCLHHINGDSGIILLQKSTPDIRNNTLRGMRNGISIFNSGGFITTNQVWKCDLGIGAFANSNPSIEANHVHECETGITSSDSNPTIVGNVLQNCSLHALSVVTGLQTSPVVRIMSNHITGGRGTGITVQGTGVVCELASNTVADVNIPIFISPTSQPLLTDNAFSGKEQKKTPKRSHLPFHRSRHEAPLPVPMPTPTATPAQENDSDFL